ncbi:MAG: NifU family protein [Planctomycetota bacterium]|nr:NifU family protein [Planctomycetota bacterium]
MSEDSANQGEHAELSERVKAVLELMRPMIQEDDGDIELVEVTPEGLVRIRFMGACIDCPSSANTLHNGIERMLKQRVPEVSGVEATDS